MTSAKSSNFIRALETGDRELMKEVPRADVHNHAALGGDFHTWTRKEGFDLSEGPHHFPDFTDFQNLVDTIFTYPEANPDGAFRSTSPNDQRKRCHLVLPTPR